MTTRGPSQKQVIIPMSKDNIYLVASKANKYIIFNINRWLKLAKLEITADFIRSDSKGIIVTTSKVANLLDLKIIKKYINNDGDQKCDLW